MDEDIENYNVSSIVINQTERFSEYNDSLKYIEKIEEGYAQVYVPIIVMSVIVSNLIVVISSGLLFKAGFEPRCTYLLLGNISLADLTTAFVVLIGWFELGELIKCKLRLSIYIMGALCSSLSVGLIAIDRYIFIMHGIKYKQIIYPQRVRYMLWGTWIIAITGGTVPLAVFGREAPECWFVLVAPPSVILITTAIGLVPLGCVIVLYSIILRKAITNVKKLERAIALSPTNGEGQAEGMRIYVGRSRHISTVSKAVEESETKTASTNTGSSTNANKKTQLKGKLTKGTKAGNNPNRWKAIKVVLFTTGTYSVSWLPYYITSSMYIFCDEEKTPSECKYFLINVTSRLGLLTFLCTFTNPIIYAWWHKRFREGIVNFYNKHKRLYRLRTNNVRSNNRNGEHKKEATHL